MFKYGDWQLEIVDKYKYFGIVLNEHFEYSIIALILVNSAGRALWAIYNKYKLNKSFGCNTCTTLYHTYHSGVVPIFDYCSSGWGYCY